MPKRKKKRDFYGNIRVKELTNWSPETANSLLTKILKENMAEIKQIYEWKTPLKKNLEKTVDDVLGVRHKTKEQFVSKLMKNVKKKADKVFIGDAIDKAYTDLNKGEVLAAQASGQRVVKIWTTMFDTRVRDWHSRMEGRKHLFNTKFRVPYPGGEDHLMAPKIPPISQANFIRCRCSLRFEVGKKRK